ncbi:TetR/AcrR family transcriptional regulator [Nocardia wallacei]|uniref:TetR/AcrR family transcriptional regulator n=1 Tax=Nocardia TaxID=1817 RepID=UPI002455BE73|nr:TetR/AcrR family transcriptional regulator [Nocardia wallacei]
MTTITVEGRPGPAEVDPRRARSRARLLEAAAELLRTGGLEAITVDAVTRLSHVARTTLYRHFDNVVHLRAATLEHLLPPVVEAPTEGTLRERLIELVGRQADVISEAPLHLTTLAWLATADAGDAGAGARAGALRRRFIDNYRRPFDELFGGEEGRAVLGDRDLAAVLAQLIGPFVFVRLSGIGSATRADCARIVDDFLAARAARDDRPAS